MQMILQLIRSLFFFSGGDVGAPVPVVIPVRSRRRQRVRGRGF